MKQLITVDLGDGTNILVEVDQLSSDEMVDISLNEVTHKAQETLAASVQKMLPVATTIVNSLRSLPHSPDDVEVSFGFNLSSQTGAFIASCGVGANFGIVLKWRKSVSE